ncbi:hypothetical protein JK636_05670 [Clostridium sp. YIM B02515]|uniref:DUF2004 domain-containing protein n=1 Tax=Clostridium rhizosphaerae TaxID=2803861 RepID=A0ABS1T8Z1_9CLOT|nr:hypothetical protein [Clostridium rhizosphaerae]MBL4935242.1 hypothetical protein [Clostridium rhizosphaerae]
MNKETLIQVLDKNGFSEIEEIDYKEDAVVVSFIYEFDNDEVEAARAYANDESEDEENGDTWYEEFFLPYLNDLAVDNVGEVIENMMEEMQIEAQYVSYELDEEEYSYNEFIAAFFPKGKVIEIEQVLDELEM